MGKRYKLKRRYSISVFSILVITIALLGTLNIGYSLWSSKLNISGKVTLDEVPQPLDVSLISNGNGGYITNTGFQTEEGTWFDFISDEYIDNSLITTIKVHENSNIDWFSSDIMITFSMKNTSNEGYLYSDGKVSLMEFSDSGKAVNNVTTNILPPNLETGKTSSMVFSATINRNDIKENTYYKYAVTYNVDGLTRYFYYTIKILPA